MWKCWAIGVPCVRFTDKNIEGVWRLIFQLDAVGPPTRKPFAAGFHRTYAIIPDLWDAATVSLLNLAGGKPTIIATTNKTTFSSVSCVSGEVEIHYLDAMYSRDLIITVFIGGRNMLTSVDISAGSGILKINQCPVFSWHIDVFSFQSAVSQVTRKIKISIQFCIFWMMIQSVKYYCQAPRYECVTVWNW